MDNIAIWISLVSILIAAISLGWNIYRDLSKPRLKVSFGLNILFGDKGIEGGPLLTISGTNFGPGKIKLNGIILKKPWAGIKRLFKKARYGFLIPDYKNPYTSHFPSDVEVGESKDYILVYNENCFLKEDFVRIGIRDSFGRIHWAPKKAYRMAKREFEKEFKK